MIAAHEYSRHRRSKCRNRLSKKIFIKWFTIRFIHPVPAQISGKDSEIGTFRFQVGNKSIECFHVSMNIREKDHPEILLEAAIPFAGQADQWPAHQRIRWAALVEQCDEKTVLRQEYSPSCMMNRNQYMVDRANILVACYDGKSGGTLNTLRYAIKKNVEILQIEI